MDGKAVWVKEEVFSLKTHLLKSGLGVLKWKHESCITNIWWVIFKLNLPLFKKGNMSYVNCSACLCVFFLSKILSCFQHLMELAHSSSLESPLFLLSLQHDPECQLLYTITHTPWKSFHSLKVWESKILAVISIKLNSLWLWPMFCWISIRNEMIGKELIKHGQWMNKWS